MAKNIAIIAANIKVQILVLAFTYDIIAAIGISIRSSFTYNMGRVANEPVSPVENPTTSGFWMGPAAENENECVGKGLKFTGKYKNWQK